MLPGPYMRKKNQPKLRRESGASLLEILIAVLILAIGLLGIAALQAVTLRNLQGSSDRSVAVIQAYAIFDMMRGNVGPGEAVGYNTGGYVCEAPPGGDREDVDVATWITQMQGAMGPTACGAIQCTAGDECTVRIRWSEERLVNPDGDDELAELTLESTL